MAARDMSPDADAARSRALPLTVPADWMRDHERASWVMNSLKARRADAGLAERNAKRAFAQPYMSEPANWLADAYAEVAAVWDRRIEILLNAAEASGRSEVGPTDGNPTPGLTS